MWRKEMERVTLGKTGITVNKNGFGALPIQRISTEDAVKLARKAYDAGITFFDTARPEAVDQYAITIALFSRIINAFALNIHRVCSPFHA
jgi:predicted aldo/keto reductase-like oxidoreductase